MQIYLGFVAVSVHDKKAVVFKGLLWGPCLKEASRLLPI